MTEPEKTESSKKKTPRKRPWKTVPLSKKEYLAKFSFPYLAPRDRLLRHEAFKYAAETRKFEIELYWKRATYFWTFIGATLVGYFTLQASSTEQWMKRHLSIQLACLGVVFSLGWFLVNKGSKKWQENWEYNVELLEDAVVGPLFKTVWNADETKWQGLSDWSYYSNWIAGSGRFSGSRINQIISFFITIFWLFVGLGAIGGSCWEWWGLSVWWLDILAIDFSAVLAILLAAGTCILFWVIGTPAVKEGRSTTSHCPPADDTPSEDTPPEAE